jgi:TatD DNase family protein
MIDSHCHLADQKFDIDLFDVVNRAKDSGIQMMICIADTLGEAKKCIDIAEQYPQIFATVGVHPHTSSHWTEDSEKQVRELVTSSKKVKAIGEIGLDFHYDLSPRDTQKKVFHQQLVIAKELDLPSVVHCREAVEDVWSIVRDVNPKKLVVHCCTEKFEDVKKFLEKGYLLSFTGIATYPNAQDIRECIRQCPMDQLMIETDAPYLAPVPYRGKRNEPAFVMEVAKLIAELKGIALQEVDEQTTKNTVEFFCLR